MKALLQALGAALLLALAAAPAAAAPFSIPEAGMSFEAPDGFTPLGQAEIDAKYPSKRGPAFVVGNERRTTTIAFDLKADRLPADKLPEVQATLEKVFERIVPGLEWKARKLIELQGQPWIYLEMSSRAVDTDIHNLMLITSRQGRMLVLNFNSTRAEFPAVEAALRRSIESLRLTAP
jgi:hypothetical protein